MLANKKVIVKYTEDKIDMVQLFTFKLYIIFTIFVQQYI